MTIKQFLKTPINELLNWGFMYKMSYDLDTDRFLADLEESPELENITLGMIIDGGKALQELMTKGEAAFK